MFKTPNAIARARKHAMAVRGYNGIKSLAFERLEQRINLATGVTAELHGSRLFVVGTGVDDTIVLDEVAGVVRVLDQGTPTSFMFPSGSVSSAHVIGLEGNDAITIDASFGSRPTTLQGDAGNDSLTGASGNDYLDGGTNSDALDGGAGNDQVVADYGDTKILGGTGIDLLNLAGETGNGTFNNNTATSGGNTGDFETIFGGSGSDSITNLGSGTAMTIFGFGGADTLAGGNGNDILIGGDGNDNLTGNDGNDSLNGETGHDTFDGGGGNDQAFADFDDTNATLGAVQIVGGADFDTLIFFAETTGITFNNNLATSGGTTGGFEDIAGSAGNDTIFNTGSSTSVHIFGYLGNDVLTGGSGIDILEGGTGDDTLIGLGGGDVLRGDEGSDAVDYSGSLAGISIDLRGLVGAGGDAQGDVVETIENVVGSDAADYIYGNVAANTLQGRGGADQIFGDGGNDALDGGAGDDQVVAEYGDATILGGTGIDLLNLAAETANGTFNNNTATSGGNTGDFETIFGGSGDDDITNLGSGTAVTIFGFAGNDTLTGGNGNDTFFGDLGNDTLNGSDGNDYLNGGTGSDALDGGAGNDQVVADYGDSKILGGAGIDLLNLAAETANGTFNNNTATSGGNTGDYEVIFGGSGNDTITNAGSGIAVTIFGFGGNDTLTGGNDNDMLIGGDDDDTLTGGPGADSFDGGSGTDTVTDFNAGEGDTQSGIP